jgi:two-component sensor histidine kinase/HAMP domain-containing protein
VLTGGFTVGDYRVDQDNDEAALPLGYPVTDEENNIKGVAFAALDLGWLRRLAASARLPSNSTLTVLDVNGIVLARYPDPELWVGRSITGLPLAETIFTSQEQGTGNVLDLNGEEQLFGFARLNDPTQSGEAYVAVGISKAVAYGPANLALRRNLIGLGITAVTALGIVWFGIEMFIVNQIRQLVAGTQRLASGDLKFGIRARQSKGELGRLATAFDQMAQQLEERESQRIQLEEERSRRMRSEIMLTEIQHRVKNSLQIAASLISLQASKLGESQSKLALQESESRIRTIAGIYGKLQIRNGTPAVDFGSFLKDTLAPLVGARAGPGRVNLQITADSILLDSEKAVPYALVANELVINCLKHAFTDGRVGTIDVAIRKAGPEGFVLTVSDDGVGFPEDLDFRSTQSLGLQVVNALVDQLHGSISLDRNGGTTFRIEFSKSPERAS